MITTMRCMLREAFGGTALRGDERLIRFIGDPNELKELLAGRLSLTQARDFIKVDKKEAAGTKADDRWITKFYGSLADLMQRRIRKNREAVLATAYVSCWHLLSKDSDLVTLAKKYTSGDFQCAVTTSIKCVRSSIPPQEGFIMWLDLFKIRYIPDESWRLQEVLEGEFPSCGYPELEFKRAKYACEQEARFVMHDFYATLVHPGPQLLLAVDRPKWCYAAIDPEAFIESIYPLNDFSDAQVRELLSASRYQPVVTRCEPEKLLALCLG